VTCLDEELRQLFLSISPSGPQNMSTAEEVEILLLKSHSNISKTVTKCLAILASKGEDSAAERKSRILQLVADAKVAGKAITIAEIVKRRLKEHGQTVNQTTSVQEKLSVGEAANERPGNEVAKNHLQDEGFEEPKKTKPNVQIVIRLQKDIETAE